MRAFKPYALPSTPRRYPCVAGGSVTHRGARGVPLPNETFQRTTNLSVACFASRLSSPLNSSPRHYSSIHSASVPAKRYPRTSLCMSIRHLLRSVPGIQKSWQAGRPAPRFRAFHISSKTDQRRYHRGAGYSSDYGDSPTVFYRSTQLAFLGTFLAIYLALQNEKQPSRLGPLLPRRQPPPESTVESILQHLMSLRRSIQKHLTFENLTYRPNQWPPDTLAKCIPYVGHIFAHGSATHLAMNSISFYVLTSFLFPTMGTLTTATTFLVGGVMAAQLDCATAKAYANPSSPWHNIVASLHVSLHDPNPNSTLRTGRLGASAGVCAMFTVMAIAHPLARGRFPLVPGSIPIWAIWIAEVAWEGYNFYNNVDDGIGHGGHLAGHVAGALLWLVALRWTPYGKWRRRVRWVEL